MPGTQRAVEVKLPEAEGLAELYSMTYDLQVAAHLCEAAGALTMVHPHDSLVVEGLITAAIIRYFRCFTPSARLGLRRVDVGALNPEALGTHDYFESLRDKLVAFSGDPLEENWVTATALEDEAARYPITSIGHGSHRMLLSVGEARTLVALAQQVRQIVEMKVVAERERVLAAAQKLPLGVLHHSDLRKPRQRERPDASAQKQARTSAPRSPQLRRKRRTG